MGQIRSAARVTLAPSVTAQMSVRHAALLGCLVHALVRHFQNQLPSLEGRLNPGNEIGINAWLSQTTDDQPLALPRTLQ